MWAQGWRILAAVWFVLHAHLMLCGVLTNLLPMVVSVPVLLPQVGNLRHGAKVKMLHHFRHRPTNFAHGAISHPIDIDDVLMAAI